MTAVRTKREGVAHFQAGKFGNFIRQWDDLESLKKDGYDGLTAVRSRTPGARYTRGPMTVAEAEVYLEELRAQGVPASDTYVGEYLEGQPEKVTFQGEVFRGPMGLTLNYTRSNKFMRVALKEDSRHAHGLEAKMLLEHYLDANSYDDLMTLLDEYESAENNGYPTSHIVEFTAMETPVGARPGRNTIFWECRLY